jgi:hypothetical protein
LTPSFEITPKAYDTASSALLIEISEDAVKYLVTSPAGEEVFALQVFSIPKKEKHSAAYIKDMLKNSQVKGYFKKTKVCYNISEQLFIPLKMLNGSGAAQMNKVFGKEPGTIILKDDITADCINIYRINGSVHNYILQLYPSAVFTHHYSCLAKKQYGSTDVLSVVFYRDKMLCTLVAKGKPEIITAYPFAVPLDAVYYLLNLVQTTGHEEITIDIKGMIDKDSAIIKEINKYFRSVNYSDAFNTNEHPAHYFSHLSAIATCA